MVRFDLLLHLRLDLLKIVRRNPVREIDIIIKAVLDRRPGGELRFRPDLQNRRRQHMRRRMTQPFDVRHLRAHFGSFAFFLHSVGGEINHEEHEGHGQFRFVLSLCGTRAFWGARAASPQCSAACRAQNPVGKLPTVAGRAACAPRRNGSERRVRNRVFSRSRRVLLLMVRFLLLASALLWASCGRAETQVADFPAQRERMVKEQIVMRGVVEERVLAAMRKVAREEFVPAEFRAESYTDRPLPIGYDQTISQPFIVGFMTEALRAQPTHRVLEIGTGSGYQAAILAELVAEVYSIEIIEPLKKNAEATLQRLGYKNVHVKAGDGYKGWPEHAPFDSIIVTCAPERVPQPLIDQLKEGGRMIIPVGAKFAQELYLLEKKDGRLEQSAVLPVRFVPMAREGAEEVNSDK